MPAAGCHLDFVPSIWPCVEAGGYQSHFSCETLVGMKTCEAVLGIYCLGLVQQFKVDSVEVDGFGVGR